MICFLKITLKMVGKKWITYEIGKKSTRTRDSLLV